MTHYCLDFCSLLNLYCGWGGIQEFHKFGTSWSISDTAFGEFEYVRIEQPDGSLQNTPVAHSLVVGQYPLSILSVSGAPEHATLIELSKKIDDGEAASLTIAAHRGLTFVSDDGAAIAAASALSVPTASALQLLIDWAGMDPAHAAQLPTIVRRIALLASYVPPKSSPYKAWWNGIHTPS